MNERRGENRLLCADMVNVEWIDGVGRFRKEVALLEDISPLGICLQTENALPESSVVLVNLRGTQTRAMVRYCKWKDIGYYVGLTFAPGCRWTREKFQPMHLVDPMTLPHRGNGFIV